MIYQQVTQTMFADAFRFGQYANQFSYEGLRELYDYLDGCFDDDGMELDTTAIACSYEETSKLELMTMYPAAGCDPSSDDFDMDEAEDRLMNYLNRHTTVVADLGDCVLIQSF